MKRKRQTASKKKATIKRATKRSVRAKQTQSEKGKKKLAAIEAKQELQRKQDEEIKKILESRTSALT